MEVRCKVQEWDATIPLTVPNNAVVHDLKFAIRAQLAVNLTHCDAYELEVFAGDSMLRASTLVPDNDNTTYVTALIVRAPLRPPLEEPEEKKRKTRFDVTNLVSTPFDVHLPAKTEKPAWFLPSAADGSRKMQPRRQESCFD